MTDPSGLEASAPGHGAVQKARDLLVELGCTTDELDAAEREGTLPLLAVERLLVPEEAEYDIAGVSSRSGVDADTVRNLWRTLGYPVPRDDEVAFTAADVAILREVGSLMAADVASAQLVGRMSRVIGSSMARIASAQVDVLSARLAGAPRTSALADDELSDDQLVLGAGLLLPLVPDVLTASWRRHLQGSIRRRLSIAETGQGQLGVVGFADLVGFTAMSQQVGDDELAAVVDEFEQLAFDAVTARGGRVVKMIGDEVMFTVDSPGAAAEIGLTLAEGTRGADELSEVRVGMAYGPLLEREGDLYGPIVNLASRITAIAYPGSILVGPGLRDELAELESYRLRAMRPRSLKDIGRVPLWVLRRAAPAPGRGTDRRRSRGRAAVDGPSDHD